MNLSRHIIVATSILGLVIFTYAWQVEPFRIETTHHNVTAGLKTPVKLMVLADLHTRGWGRLETAVLKVVAEERPDLIVVVGDCFVPNSNHEDAHRLLSAFKAPLGVWLVPGNWEHWNPVENEQDYYASAGIRPLSNAWAQPRGDISLIGFDDPFSGKPDIELAEKGLKAASFRIALFHSPAFFDKVAGRYPLAIAGHTHGGQIRLPGFGPIWLPGGCGKYVEGWYTQGKSRLYVTRGVGTSVLPLRLFCRPEIPVITIS